MANQQRRSGEAKSSYEAVLAEADGYFFSNDLLPVDGTEIDISKYTTAEMAVLTSIIRITLPKPRHRYLYTYRTVLAGHHSLASLSNCTHKMVDLDAVRSIALQVRNEFIADGNDVDGGCVGLSEGLCSELARRGCDARTVRGTFRTDRPYDRCGTQPDPCAAFHQWVEIDGLIVDATADQFNDYLDVKASQILVGTYEELRRYEKYVDGSGVKT